jgi:hypothetical protein
MRDACDETHTGQHNAKASAGNRCIATSRNQLQVSILSNKYVIPILFITHNNNNIFMYKTLRKNILTCAIIYVQEDYISWKKNIYIYKVIFHSFLNSIE